MADRSLMLKELFIITAVVRVPRTSLRPVPIAHIRHSPADRDRYPGPPGRLSNPATTLSPPVKLLSPLNRAGLLGISVGRVENNGLPDRFTGNQVRVRQARGYP